MNEYEGFKIGDKVVTRAGYKGTVIGFKKVELTKDCSHYIVVREVVGGYTNNWFPSSLTTIKEEEKRMGNEMYIVTTDESSSVSSTKKGAEDVITDLLETGICTADQIYVYKGVEVGFSHGVSIKEK